MTNRIEEVKKIIESGYALHSIRQGMGVFIRTESDEKLARQICQLFPQPLDDEELGKAIQDILDTAITVDNNCNEITKKTQILALLQPKIRQERERIETHLADLELHSMDSTNFDSKALNFIRHIMKGDWQALKGGE